ncbi:MAG TPA: MtrB/PioB family decaheme-associated outer membrane protein, partial [Burkholderiales bacterium]|nr:MtrB/PioB family decaheme-associated outer membrane protein [Burkholderiales bacterium]
LNEKGGYGILDFNWANRDDSTGTWMRAWGRNIGYDSRELQWEHNRQGDWGYFVNYNQIPRYSPYTINTGVQGIGTANLNIPYPAATSPKSDVQLKTERDILTLGGSKNFGAGWDAQVRFRNEEKDGARIFGRGTTGGTGGFEFTPDPIHYKTNIIEATVGYSGAQFQMSGGYYGTWFTNENMALRINNQPGGPTGLGTGAGAFSPIGLPPGNESHQLFLSGGYSFTPTTRATFKFASQRQTQDEAFILPTAVGVGRTSLGGRVDTTQAQLGLTARPMAGLSLLANLRYDDRNDKTPVVDYFPTVVTGTATGVNEPRSVKTTAGKLEASYALPMGFRVIGGLDYEEKKRNTSDIRVVSFREKTDETTWRVELRRSISETVNGSVQYASSRRRGSDWVTTTQVTAAGPPPVIGIGSNLVDPLHLADRDRDKVRVMLDWAATEAFSMQFAYDDARDDYNDRNLGPRKGKQQLFSVDANYQFTPEWQGFAYGSWTDLRADQVTCVGASGVGVCPNTAASPIWESSFRNKGDAFGLGARGKFAPNFDFNASLSFTKDRGEFNQSPLAVPNPIGTPLPNIEYNRTTLNLNGKYALMKNAGIRVQYIYDRFKTDDFTWTQWVYTDGTRVLQNQTQTVHFIGVSGYYEFR